MTMYQSIYVPVDNSDHSNRAIDTSVRLGSAFRSKLVGCHVYAASMHDYRFKQMEFTLPEEYLEENELHRQRKIHDSLITMGLELISDCYLSEMRRFCEQQDLEFEPRMMDGKHSTELLKDMAQNEYDLVVLGSVGIGRTRDSQLGSVCQRISREAARDVWVVKHLPQAGEPERDTIMVGIDGSPESFGAMETALELARKLGKKVELVGVYDPYLHYAVFKSIVEVLTEKAAKVFRFEEQNQLHEEIIDTGLAEIYQSHLNVAESMAREDGVEVTKTLLDGKAFQKILDHARKTQPFLLVVGRKGIHAEEDESGLGSNTENLLRLVECDVLLTTRAVTPELDTRAEESIHWTPEAEERMTRVPEQVKGIARTAILRLAVEHGHSVVTSDLVTEAMERFMPGTSKVTQKLAEGLAFEKARTERVSLCKTCHTVALVPDPERCSSCGGTDFEVLSRETVDQIAESEGGTEEELTYDGRKLRWSQEARKALRSLGDNYQRRRAKARIEKAARLKKLDTITLEAAQRFIEEETGVLYRPAEGDEGLNAADRRRREEENQPAQLAGSNGNGKSNGNGNGAAAEAAELDTDKALLGRDAKNVPLFSALTWNAAAVERILRVPAGYMRDRTQARIEGLATERGVGVDLALVEEGIEIGLQMMKEMLAAEGATDVAAPAPAPAPAPVVAEAAPEAPAKEAKAGGECPFARAAREAGLDAEGMRLALNEVSVMSEMEKRRLELKSEQQTD